MRAGETIERAVGRILAGPRRSSAARSSLALRLRPSNYTQVLDAQQAASGRLGVIGGWHVCRLGPHGISVCTPLPLTNIQLGPARVITDGEPLARLDTAVCFRIGRNPRDYGAPYTRERVLAAIESCHPAVAVLDRHAGEPSLPDSSTTIAEGNGYRHLVCGRAMPAWPMIGVDCVSVTAFQGGSRVFSHEAALTDDPIELLHWLANEGARWGSRLTVGQWIAIGLGAGEICIPTSHPTRIVVGSIGSVDVRFS